MLVVKIGIEDDEVDVGGHDDKGIDPQLLVAVADIQALGEDETGFSCDEDG